jgi:hypothetical protein
MGTIASGRSEPSEVIGVWGYQSTFDWRVAGIRKLQSRPLWDRLNNAIAGQVSSGSSSAIVIHERYLPNLIDGREPSDITNSYPSSLIRNHRSLSSFDIIASSDGGVLGRLSRIFQLGILLLDLFELSPHNTQLPERSYRIGSENNHSEYLEYNFHFWCLIWSALVGLSLISLGYYRLSVDGWGGSNWWL